MSDNQPQQPPAVPTTANGHRERRPWTEDEDRLLRDAIAREDPGANPPSKWHAIATHVPNRTNKDCRKRWWAQMATTVAKGGWSAEEDDRLCTAVEEFGTKWALVATRVQTRNSGQCAKRWNDALNPAIDRSEWTDEEDVKLLEAVKTQGKSWTNIVRQLLPGRTGLAAKNRYNHLTRASSDRAQARERRKTAAGPYARGGAASGAPPVSTSSATSVNGSPTSQLSRAHSPRTPPDGYVQPKTEEGQYYRPGDYPSNGAQAPQQPQQTSDERPLSLPHAPYPPPPLAGYPYRVAQPNTPIDSPRSATAAYPPGPYFNHGGPPPAGVYHHSSQPPTPASALGPPGPPYFPSAPPPTGYDARAAAFEHQRRSMQPSPSSAHAYPPDQAGQYGHHPEYRGQQGQASAGGYERRYDEGYESVPGVSMQPVANGMVNQSSW